MFILGICFGILLLKVDIKLVKDSVPVDASIESRTNVYTTQTKSPDSSPNRIITGIAAEPEDVTTASETAGITEPEDGQYDKKVTELLTIAARLRKDLEEMKVKRLEDQQRVDNLTKQNQQPQDRNREISQPALPRTKPEAVSAEKVTLPAVSDSPLQTGLKAYDSGNYVIALKLLAPLAAKGDALAQFRIALMYKNGLGIIANNTVALDWMLKAARQGQPEAQIELARCYANGINGVQDPFLAYTWYLVAEKNGVYKFVDERTGIEGRIQREMMPQAAALATQLQQQQIKASVKEGMAYE